MRRTHVLRSAVLATVAAVGLSGCGFSPYDLPLPGGADTGDQPYEVKVEFRDVLDLVPQSAVRVNDIAVGKVTDIELKGWTAVVTLQINGDTELPENAEATLRQTSLLGEKFVALGPPSSGNAAGKLGDGDTIALAQSGRNPEIEEVLGAASLLFNGGGLDKTNTIVKELNNALGGNEPEVKELIDSTSTFLTQLDDNKDALLTSLEKVNNLAIQTQKQKGAITSALDELPEALTVINDQRDDLVTLLQSLDRLGDVATDVIAESKDDAVADLKALVPILRNLELAGDDLAYGFKALLTYPFTDGVVGNTIAKASGRCDNTDRDANTGYCVGDYANLSIRLDLGADQLEQLLGGIDLGEALPQETPLSGLPADDLVDLVEGLVPAVTSLPDLGLPGQTVPKPTETSKAPTGDSGLSGFCTLLGQCRTAVGDSSDLHDLLVDPVVAP